MFYDLRPVLYPWMIVHLNQRPTHISPTSPTSYCCLRKPAVQTSDAVLQHGISQGMPLLLGDKVSLWSSDLKVTVISLLKMCATTPSLR